ncbi:hypothetical protein BG004_006312 [Podila humilis]|nr:hypothetical protein BG004_006312 [Podila humilis]
MDITEPSQLQQNFIPPILNGHDVLIRDTTGSGKTFGILLALLNKPRSTITMTMTTTTPTTTSSGQPQQQRQQELLGITSVLVVPNQELAFQLLSWTRTLFPNATEKELDSMIQAIYTESSPLSPSIASISDGKHRKIKKRHLNTSNQQEQQQQQQRQQSFTISDSIDTQVQKLTQALPHVLVATPHRLWNLLERGILDLSQIETLVLDEVDHLIRLPARFASQRQIYSRDLHPKPAELALREIIRSASASALNNKDQEEENEEEEDGVSSNSDKKTKKKRIQIVAASATMNRPIRYWLESNDFIREPVWVDTTKSVVLPEGIEHSCLVVGPDSIRNMKLEGDSHNARNSDKDEGAQEDEDDINWQDKDKSWKEQQQQVLEDTLNDPTTTAVTKFRDDDDRMLESVSMACMLDEIDSACVFFCSAPSLNDVAARLQGDFGMSSVKLLDDAFHHHHHHRQDVSTTTKTKKNKGIYLAHELNARGLDLPGLSHVIIVGMPSAPSSYLHMAGRTGRMGKTGRVLTIIRDDGNLEARARSLFNTLNVQIKPYSHVE